MFARAAIRSTAPRFTRTYAQEGVAGKEPINMERGSSRTPFFIAAALAVLGGGYFLGVGNTPPTPAVKNMQGAMAPKTAEAKSAAGMSGEPTDEPSKAGGDRKGRE
ncbi:hypothetical protein JCM6882_001099 [Rhodosporidiobolus microsporus]